MAVKLREPATEIDLLSFIKASLDEFEGITVCYDSPCPFIFFKFCMSFSNR